MKVGASIIQRCRMLATFTTALSGGNRLQSGSWAALSLRVCHALARMRASSSGDFGAAFFRGACPGRYGPQSSPSHGVWPQTQRARRVTIAPLRDRPRCQPDRGARLKTLGTPWGKRSRLHRTVEPRPCFRGRGCARTLASLLCAHSAARAAFSSSKPEFDASPCGSLW